MVAAAAAALTLVTAGCEQAAIQANEQQLQAQQQQLDQLRKQIEALKAQQSYPSAPPPGTPGTCDYNVMHTATRRGGEAFSSGNMKRALGYYQDALTACPGNTRALLNVARTNEALGNREQAITYYRQAAASTTGDPRDVESARAALSRLSASR